MLNNLTNFFNLIIGRRIKKTLEPSDLIAIGTKQSPALGDYKPTAIKFSDLQAQLGGGGGVSDLQQVTNLGNTTTFDINLDNSAIVLDNGSSLRKGSLDNGADGGIARECAVNYQDQWENGVQYFINQGGAVIRANSINGTTPNANFDINRGYVVGSIFHNMNNQNKYICTDNTNGAAVWDPYYDAVETDGVTITGNGTLGSPLVAAGVPSWLEYNATDLTIWNNGQGNVSSNTSYGDGALRTAAGMSLNNTAIGKDALSLMLNGANNTAVGQASLLNNLGSFNTAVGAATLQNNTTGSGNTALGYTALQNNQTGVSNTAVGLGALNFNTVGGNNTAFGQNALAGNTTGYQNTAVGTGSMALNDTGYNNIAFGYNSLVLSTTGNSNTALGYQVLQNNTTGINNTAVGLNALFNNTTAFDNVAIGNTSLFSNTTGVNNSAIGVATNSGNFNGSVILGKSATATADNQFVVGSSTVNAGTVKTETITPDNTWLVRINGVNYKIPLLLIP